MDIKSMIEKVVKLGGDELYLKIGTQPLVRINDVLSSMDLPALIEGDMNDLIETLLTKDEIVKFQKNGIFEANYFGQSPCNFRISLFHSQQSPVAYIKIINSEIPELKDLDLPASLANLLGSPKGILILAGPSRSGISTTMAALVEHMNRKYKRHILVIIEACFKLKKGDPILIKRKIEQYRNKRLISQPLNSKTLGCTFKNPPFLSAGRLIDDCELKGLTDEGVKVSTIHGNFLEFTKKKSTKNALRIIDIIIDKVYNKTNLELELELLIVG